MRTRLPRFALLLGPLAATWVDAGQGTRDPWARLESCRSMAQALGEAWAELGCHDLACLTWSAELRILADLRRPLEMRERAGRYVERARGHCSELSLARLRACLAEALRTTGELAEGERQALAALAVARASGDDRLHALCAMDSAWAVGQAGRTREMCELFREAEEFARRGGDDERVLRARNARAGVLAQIGEVDEARTLYREAQAEAHHSERHDLCFESAVRAAELELSVLRDEGDGARSERALARMESTFHELEGSQDEAVLLALPRLDARRLRCLLNYHDAHGDLLPEELVAQIETMLAGSIQPHDHASLMHGLARHFLASGDLARARALAESTIASASPLGLALWVERGGLILGECAALEGRVPEAVERLRSEFAALEELPFQDVDIDGWILHGRMMHQIASGLVATLYRAESLHPDRGFATLALELYDRGRATALRERSEHSDGAVDRSTSILAGLAPDALLLAFDTRARVLLAAFAGEIALLPLPTEAELRRRIEFLRTALLSFQDAVDYQRQAGELSRLVLGPLSDWLARARVLIAVPSGPLHALPLDLWLEPDDPGSPAAGLRGLHYLFLERAIFHSPTVRPLREPGPRTSAAERIFLFAPDTAHLPASLAEVRTIAELWSSAQVLSLTGEAATEAALLGLHGTTLRGIHLSGHVQRVPEQRSLGLCCAPGSGGDATIDVRELMHLQLDAEWVVLAVCDGGTGEQAQSEGALTLGWAFLHAGARSVLLAPAPVPDEPTRTLVEAYHRCLARGLEPSEALHAARRELWQRSDERGLEAALLPFYSLRQSW